MTASTIAGAALTAGSMAANSIASNKQASARNEVLQRNAFIQSGYDSKIAASHAAELAPYSSFGTDNVAKESELAGLFNRGLIGSGTGPASAIPEATSALVANEDAKRAAQAQTFAEGQGKAAAAVRAPGLTLGDANVVRAKNAADASLQDSFKVQMANLMPQQLDAANQQGAGFRALGDILKGAGQLGIAGGIANSLKGAGGATKAMPTMSQGGFGPDMPGFLDGGGFSSLLPSFM